MRQILFYILIGFLLFSCKDEKPPREQNYYYSVITFLENNEEYKYTFETLQNTIHDTLIGINEKSFTIGEYDTYREACDKGFELYADNYINNFDVLYKDSVIKNDYNPFYFVGLDLGRPALYKTDILDINPELIWSKWGREIMRLHRSQDRQKFFYTASLAEDIRGDFPLVMDARLYMFHRSNDKIDLVHYFGRGLNLSAGWENDTTLTAYFTILDSMLTSTIIQKEFTYNINGELQDTTERIFELVKDGIPIPTFVTINPISPNLRYKITITNTDSIASLSVIDELNGTNNFIANVKGELVENSWNTQSDYLFASFSEKTNPDTTDLYIVNLKEMKLTRHFRSKGQKNFIIIGNLLIFDNGFGQESFITLFRYRKNEVFSEIRIPGGCGVNSIPAINYY